MADVVEIDLEEGECSTDSDGSTNDFGDQVMASSVANKANPPYSHGPSAAFPARIPQIIINSDDSDDSDSEKDCPLVKKSCSSSTSVSHNPWSRRDHVSSTFVNPLVSNSNEPMLTEVHAVSERQNKKRNNIWGSVLTEQVLAHDIKDFNVNMSGICMNSRDVETYDYTKAQEDERPDLEFDADDIDISKEDIFGGVVDLEKEAKLHENRKRKRCAKERLGKRGYDKSKPRNLKVTAQSDIPEIVDAITEALKEPNIELFTRIVETIGKDLALKLFYMTEDVEDAGGMMTLNGYRRRTPGGVYIQLLKSDSLVSSDKLNIILGEDQLRWWEQQKQNRKIKKAARKRRNKEKKATMDMDRPETPTPSEDLEVLNALDSNNEFDASDLPERPATPEPKDDSSDGDGEDAEDEEEEDISIAISRAKAAILRKQRELANASCQDGSGEMGDDNLSSPSHQSIVSMKDDGKEDESRKASFHVVHTSSERLTVGEDVGDMEDS